MLVTIIFILTNHIYIFFFRLLILKLYGNENNSRKTINKYFKAALSNGNDIMESSLLSHHSGTTSMEISPQERRFEMISHSNSKLLICHYATEQIQ